MCKMPKYIDFSHIFILTTVLPNGYYGEGDQTFKKHSHRNWPLPSPNTTFFVPPWSVSSPQNDSTIYFFATMISPNWPSYVSNITTTNQVDTDFNNDDDLQYFATFRNTIAFPIDYVIQIIHLPRFSLNSIPVYSKIFLQYQ